jgi:beta-lactam-binding protein with PASTA domain
VRSAAAALALGLGLPSALTACGDNSSAGQRDTARSTSTTTTTTTTVAPSSSTTTTTPGVVVPDVIGQKIGSARSALHTAGFRTVSLNAACNEGTPASQSVVSSLALPGQPPDRAVGAMALNPGTLLPAGTAIGITWSGCYGNGSVVPLVVGVGFPVARHALRLAGLTWACYSVGRGKTTTTNEPPNLVLSQQPSAGAIVTPGTTVTLTMRACPQ